MKWELIERVSAYDGFFRLEHVRLRHRLHAGGWSETLSRELVSRANVVAVLPYDPERDKVVLIEQFRVGAIDGQGSPWLTEIVAGLIKPGEHPEQVAHREAREEAGCDIEELIHIYDYYPSPGGYTERISLYLAKVDSRELGGLHGLAEEGEDIEVHVVDAEDAFKMVTDGHIVSAIPIIGLQWLQINRERVRSL